jgi:hypothetical protein
MTSPNASWLLGTTVTKAHQVQLFLAGLEKPLRTDVMLH